MFENNTIDESCLENLHEELIISIFQYLPVKDLKSLLLTNKYLNTLITSSSSLMRKIVLKFNFKRKSEYDYLMESLKKYQRLRVVEATLEDAIEDTLLKSIPSIKSDLFEIELRGCKLEKRNLLTIFQNLPELKKISVTNTLIGNMSETLEGKAVLMKLKVLKISHSNFCFDLLTDTPKLEELIVDLSGSKSTQLSLTGFDDYFKTLKSLKYFESVSVLKKEIFDSDGFDETNINLAVLKICQCHFLNKKCLESFVKTQRQIEIFELSIDDPPDQNEVDEFGDYVEILDIILKLTTLKTFSLETNHLNTIRYTPIYFNVNSNVTSFICNTDGLCNEKMIRLFPNLQHLELKTKVIEDYQIDFLNQTLEKLESLKLVTFPSDAFKQLKLKNLKTIEIYETNIEPLCWNDFIKNHQGISKLIVNYSFFMEMGDEVIDYITKELKNLVHFELIDKYIGTKNDIYKLICENCQKLEYLKLWNINIEEDFNDDDKDYLKRRGVKFDLFNDVSLNKVSWIF